MNQARFLVDTLMVQARVRVMMVSKGRHLLSFLLETINWQRLVMMAFLLIVLEPGAHLVLRPLGGIGVLALSLALSKLVGKKQLLAFTAFFLVFFQEWNSLLIGLITIPAGAMNAVVGGGGILTLSLMLALDFAIATAVALNRVTFGWGAWTSMQLQSANLSDEVQIKRSRLLLAICIPGGVAGSVVTLAWGYGIELVAPLFILGASLMTYFERRGRPLQTQASNKVIEHYWPLALLFLNSAYGASLGGGVAIVYIWLLMKMIPSESIHRVLAVRQVASFGYNVGAIVAFALSLQIQFPELFVMLLAAEIGAEIGNEFLKGASADLLKKIVGVVGVVLAVIVFYKNWSEYVLVWTTISSSVSWLFPYYFS